MIYKYKAISKSGQIIEGFHEATSESDVISMIKGNNYIALNVERDIGAGAQIELFMPKVKKKDLAIFCRQFYTMLDAGSSMLNCLEILKDQTGNKKLKIALEEVYDDVQKGNTLSQSMEKQNKIFPYLFINMVQAGEVSGKLDTIMLRMTEHYEKENKINGKMPKIIIKNY